METNLFLREVTGREIIVLADSMNKCLWQWSSCEGLRHFVGAVPASDDLNNACTENAEIKEPGQSFADDFGSFARFGSKIQGLISLVNSSSECNKSIILLCDTENKAIRQIDVHLEMVTTLISDELTHTPTAMLLDGSLGAFIIAGGEIYYFDRVKHSLQPFQNKDYMKLEKKCFLSLAKDDAGSLFASTSSGSVVMFYKDRMYTLLSPPATVTKRPFLESRGTLVAAVTDYFYGTAPEESVADSYGCKPFIANLQNPNHIIFDSFSAACGNPRLFISSESVIYVLNLSDEWYCQCKELERMRLLAMYNEQLFRLEKLSTTLKLESSSSQKLEQELHDLQMANQKLDAKLKILQEQNASRTSSGSGDQRTSTSGCFLQ